MVNDFTLKNKSFYKINKMIKHGEYKQKLR